MRTAIRIWRVLTWILGGVFVIPSAFLLWMEITEPMLREYYASIALTGLFFLASVLGPVAAVAMKRGTRWARLAGWIAASVQTLAIPLFTPLGLFGLILMSCGAGKPGTRPASASPSQRGATVAAVVTALLVVFFSIDGFFRWARHLDYHAPAEAIALSILWACIVLEIAIHEGGHALAVKLVRGNIHRFQIGPVWWRRESGRTWIEFWRSLPSAGSVAWTPGSVHQLTRQHLLVTAGGPFASLVCGLIALATFPWLGKLGVPQEWPWAMFLALAGITSLMNLWPIRKGYQASDGATIRGLLTSANFRRLTEIALLQSMSDSSGLRPREWSRMDLEWMLALEDVAPIASHQSAILQAACAHYLDSGDAGEAVRCARRFQGLALEQPKRCSPSSFPEATFTLAFYGGDPEGARDLWARRPAGLPVQFELAECLASAAIAGEDSEAAIRRAWACSELYGSSGTLEYLREQLRRLEMGSLASVPIATPRLQSEQVSAILWSSSCSARPSACSGSHANSTRFQVP